MVKLERVTIYDGGCFAVPGFPDGYLLDDILMEWANDYFTEHDSIPESVLIECRYNNKDIFFDVFDCLNDTNVSKIPVPESILDYVKSIFVNKGRV
jgi:hypothetical protein